MISKKKNLEFKGIFRPKTGDLPLKKGLYPKNVMKSGVDPQKLRKYRRQTPIWASICTPIDLSLLIFSGHRPRLGGGHNFCLGGHKQSFGGTASECPQWRRVWGHLFFTSNTSRFFNKTYFERCLFNSSILIWLLLLIHRCQSLMAYSEVEGQ